MNNKRENEIEKEVEPQNLSSKIFEQIRKDNISPTSKINLAMRDSALWLPGILITLLGAFAVAGIIFSETHAGWEYRQYIHPSPFLFIVQALPLIWIILFGVFALIIVKMLRLTSRGYKYQAKVILASSLLISILLGFLIFIIDNEIKENNIIRYPAQRIQHNIWTQPNTGKIFGRIDLQDNGNITLIDSMGKNWIINANELISDDGLQDGQMVRFVGKQIDDDNFTACLMFPWEFDRHEIMEANNEIRKHKNITLRDNMGKCNEILNLLRLQMQ